MSFEQIVDIEKALDEKKQMQKIFMHDNGCPSSVLALLITYFEERKKK